MHRYSAVKSVCRSRGRQTKVIISCIKHCTCATRQRPHGRASNWRMKTHRPSTTWASRFDHPCFWSKYTLAQIVLSNRDGAAPNRPFEHQTALPTLQLLWTARHFCQRPWALLHFDSCILPRAKGHLLQVHSVVTLPSLILLDREKVIQVNLPPWSCGFCRGYHLGKQAGKLKDFLSSKSGSKPPRKEFPWKLLHCSRRGWPSHGEYTNGWAIKGVWILVDGLSRNSAIQLEKWVPTFRDGK